MDQKSKIILISGPTASGKSNFAIKLAKKVNGEIINADSMQVYKELKILTARPNKKDYKKVKHHLYGIVNLNNKFSSGKWLKLAVNKIKEIRKKNKVAIIVGGTGLYFQSLIKGLVKIPHIPYRFRKKVRLIQKKEGQNKFYKKLLKIDSKIKDKINPNDVQRSIRAYEVKMFTNSSIYEWIEKTRSHFNENEFFKIYLSVERTDLINRIAKRVSRMIKEGAISEVKHFNKFKILKEHTVNKVIGIKELNRYLGKEIKIERAKELIAIRTRQYAKRQSTWARSRMVSWNIIDQSEISKLIKKINKSSLKLDQLI